MNNIMVDLETLGTAPGSVVLSIGAVYFGPEGLGEQFYSVISLEDSERHGLTTDDATVNWWKRQSPGAREVLEAVKTPDAPSLKVALDSFTKFVHGTCKIWGNGAGFDNVLLEELYRALRLTPPWKFWDSRCFRTLKALFPQPKKADKVVAHNALQDAIDQAEEAVVILKYIADLEKAKS